MKEILSTHASRYPEWVLADLYKLIYQAAMGPEHALTDETQARELLFDEIARLKSGPDEPLLERISPDGRMVRVHLRPFIKLGFSPEQLLEAFLASARTFSPSKDRLPDYASEALQAAREGRIAFSQSQLKSYFSEMRDLQFPPVHHSDEYRHLYRPAYRVVTTGLLPVKLKT
jgi:hypothetical protein